MQKTKALIRSSFIIMGAFLFLLGLSISLKAKAWESATEGISFDPATNNIIFTTIDRQKTSNIIYQTFGFTIADATRDENGVLKETGLGEFNFPLTGAEAQEPIPLGNGMIQTTWIIPYSTILENIAATSTEWYNRVQNPTTPVYLKMDAIIGVYNMGKYPATGGWSGSYGELGMVGILWDKYTKEDLYTTEPWASPDKIKNHFDRYLMLALGSIQEPELPVVEQPNVRFDIGKAKPDFTTYNYSTNGQFNLGSGIPTSEQVTNGYEADAWYGYASVAKTAASRDYAFHGNITYNDTTTVHIEEYDPETDSTTIVPITVTVSVTRDYSHTVRRNVKFWNVINAVFWDLHKIKTENRIFPDGMPNGYLNYNSDINTNFHVTVNGVDMSSVPSISYGVDPNWHIQWPEVSNRTVHGSGVSMEAAASSFRIQAEGRVPLSSDIQVRNDDITINGKSYMSSNFYRYGEFKEEKGHWNSYLDIGANDYGVEKDEQTITIPSTVPNGEYLTTVTATYKQICTNNETASQKQKSPINSTKTERITQEYLGNEPVIVHTPTISPVEVINPSTGNKLTPTDMQTQLLPSATNTYADYQLLLDGTYTIKFKPETHFEHIGYPQMAESLYNKYCKFKQACFPFTVQIDGKIYTPDNNLTDAYGSPKKAGYTEWIDLPDFSISNFYIPSWSQEGSNYVVMFRVAPENVVDMYGVNHIDDEEWLKNHTINGSSLYNYISTYTFTAQVSGMVYDFQAVGINDRDVYEGFKNDSVSNGMGQIQEYPFCPTKQEKKAGTKNRVGGTSVRYTVDGKVTNNWDIRNTLPFSNGSSLVYSDDGTLRKDNRFAFTIRTISNLYDEENDYIKIKPTFRWVSEDGSVTKEHDDIRIYYKKYGEDKLYDYTEYGSTNDTMESNKTSIAAIPFKGSFYGENDALNRVLYQDDAEFSKDHANDWLYEKNHQTIPSWPREVYPNANAYIRKEAECYSLSEIVLNSDLRLLTGNLEQLERNLTREYPNLESIRDKDINGRSYEISERTDPDLWYKHRESMQTWFGEYWIPDTLYITDKDVDIFDYMDQNGYLDGTEDFWIKDGYLVLNFEIITVNNGQEHLTYFGGTKDMWTIQGAPTRAETGEAAVDKEFTVPVRPGDVAIVDVNSSVKNRFEVGINYIGG